MRKVTVNTTIKTLGAWIVGNFNTYLTLVANVPLNVFYDFCDARNFRFKQHCAIDVISIQLFHKLAPKNSIWTTNARQLDSVDLEFQLEGYYYTGKTIEGLDAYQYNDCNDFMYVDTKRCMLYDTNKNAVGYYEVKVNLFAHSIIY
jgi:hypothetical protein